MVLSRSARTIEVLLVEDNLAHAELVRRTLESHSLPKRIHHVTDGEAALDFLFRRGEYRTPVAVPTPQVVMLDLRLPKLDGIEVLTRIRASSELEQLPVVILTTSAAERDVTKAYDQHANAYVVKPADFEGFEQLMQDFGDFWLSWNEYPD
jgi:CheY-like chemotaxis protein